MVINWSSSAIDDLKEFKEYTKKSDSNKYILELIHYADNLITNPRLGKIYSYVNETIVRQLVYREHKIYYYIDDNKIHILTIVHHCQDMKTRINYIKKFFKK